MVRGWDSWTLAALAGGVVLRRDRDRFPQERLAPMPAPASSDSDTDGRSTTRLYGASKPKETKPTTLVAQGRPSSRPRRRGYSSRILLDAYAEKCRRENRLVEFPAV